LPGKKGIRLALSPLKQVSILFEHRASFSAKYHLH
jgi:hypothetical protein